MSEQPDYQELFSRVDQRLGEAQRILQAIGFDDPPYIQGAKNAIDSQIRDTRSGIRNTNEVLSRRTGD